jgi:hypothetical protein
MGYSPSRSPGQGAVRVRLRQGASAGPTANAGRGPRTRPCTSSRVLRCPELRSRVTRTPTPCARASATLRKARPGVRSRAQAAGEREQRVASDLGLEAKTAERDRLAYCVLAAADLPTPHRNQQHVRLDLLAESVVIQQCFSLTTNQRTVLSA